jgi:integrase/recombinase XerD
MVTDAAGALGDTICLTDIASKGRSGRFIPINKDLVTALAALKAEADKATGTFLGSDRNLLLTNPTDLDLVLAA